MGCPFRTPAVAVRVQRILVDYEFWVRHPAELKAVLQRLRKAHGQAVLDEWGALIDAGEWEAFVERLLLEHYDRTYGHQAAKHTERTNRHVDLLDFGEDQLRAFVDAATGAWPEARRMQTEDQSQSTEPPAPRITSTVAIEIVPHPALQ